MSGSSLPKGQQLQPSLLRFGLTPFAYRFPKQIEVVDLQVRGRVEKEVRLSDELAQLPRQEIVADFHCVTTWSAENIKWGGYRFSDFYQTFAQQQCGVDPKATLVRLKSQDGYRTAMLLEDLLADDVLLADSLNGESLIMAHGAPLRLVAPPHYGCKSVKYLSAIEFVYPEDGYKAPGPLFMDHLRARVALEERGRGMPGWFYRKLYTPLVKPTAKRFAKTLAARLAR